MMNFNLEDHKKTIQKIYSRHEYLIYFKPIFNYYTEAMASEPRRQAKSMSNAFISNVETRFRHNIESIGDKEYIEIEKALQIMQEEKAITF
jgi:hypothetical protein